jgi:uncharacterized protein (DUF58 family)
VVSSLREQRAFPLVVKRDLPSALALGVPRELALSLLNPGPHARTVDVFDEVDGRLDFDGLPQRVTVPAGKQVELRYTVTPHQRGPVSAGTTQLRLRTRHGTAELRLTVGEARPLHVYPNFAAVARYAWLAGDRRLAQIGIKAYRQRGMGTDFKPLVREYQDQRDQSVLFLLDCGRRMRADEAGGSAHGSHFDQALNALMLLSHVALKDGDEVGVMTFGTAPGEQRHIAPRKGAATLNALIAQLYGIQPGSQHADYLQAAQEALKRHRKRALVILLTNFRDEDASELAPAVKLMRSRHLVLVASLRERVLRETSLQAMPGPQQVAEVATAHLFDQARRDAFRRVVGNDALSVDVEPGELAVTLVNRYHAAKRAGLL